METTMIIWILIALFAVAVIIDYFMTGGKHHGKVSFLSRPSHHIVEMGTESDEIYVPGDITIHHDSDIIEYEEEL